MSSTTRRVQTIIRLNPTLLETIRRQAKRSSRSFNSYVEKVLETACNEEFPHIEADATPSELVVNLSCCSGMPSQEQIAADPRLSGILGL